MKKLIFHETFDCLKPKPVHIINNKIQNSCLIKTKERCIKGTSHSFWMVKPRLLFKINVKTSLNSKENIGIHLLKIFKAETVPLKTNINMVSMF